MRRLLPAALALAVLTGCGSGSSSQNQADNKQPQLQGPPDPRIKGPAVPAGGQKAGAIK